MWASRQSAWHIAENLLGEIKERKKNGTVGQYAEGPRAEREKQLELPLEFPAKGRERE